MTYPRFLQPTKLESAFANFAIMLSCFAVSYFAAALLSGAGQ